MITKEIIGRIRQLHCRKNKSEREIARMTALSRNTVAKWLDGEVAGLPKSRRGEMPNKLRACHDVLKLSLKADARSFKALGGVARHDIHDTMKTAVDKVKKGNGRVVNERFATMCSRFSFDPDFCV